MASTPADMSSHSSSEFGPLRQLIEAYTALPAPRFLSSGMPNVWRVRIIICDDRRKYDKATGKLVLQPKRFRCSRPPEYPHIIDVPLLCAAAEDGWESVTFGVELTPFDLIFSKPLFCGGSNSLSLYTRETAQLISENTAADSLRFSMIGWPLHASILNMLCRMFTNQTQMDTVWTAVGPQLRCLMKPLGGWRPHKLVVHDVHAAKQFSYIENLATGKVTEEQLANAGTTPVSLNNDLHVGAVPQIPIALYPDAASFGLLVVCAHCGQNGVQKDRHGLLTKHKRCGGCQVNW